MKKSRLILILILSLSVLVTANLAVLVVGSIDPTRKLKIQQLETRISELEEEKIQLQETITSSEEAHQNDMRTQREDYEEKLSIKDAEIVRLEGIVDGNNISNISTQDLEELYEYHFLMGMFFQSQVRDSMLPIQTEYNRLVTRPETQAGSFFRIWLMENNLIHLSKIFELRFDVPTEGYVAAEPRRLNTAPFAVRINNSWESANEYLLEYVVSYLELSERFEENDLPSSTDFISRFINFKNIRSGFFGSSIERLNPHSGSAVQVFNMILSNPDQFDYDEYWEGLHPNMNELTN